MACPEGGGLAGDQQSVQQVFAMLRHFLERGGGRHVAPVVEDRGGAAVLLIKVWRHLCGDSHWQ